MKNLFQPKSLAAKLDEYCLDDNWFKTAQEIFNRWNTQNELSKESGSVHTNTIEGFFSIFKRGMKGVYQHCKSNHSKRYLCEFDFRYNAKEITDSKRAEALLAGVMGKRLTYRISSMA